MAAPFRSVVETSPRYPQGMSATKGRTMNITTSNPTTTILRAEGFTCPSCVTKIEKRLGRLAGVESVTVHYASARIEIRHDAEIASPDTLIAEVAKTGYTARRAAF